MSHSCYLIFEKDRIYFLLLATCTLLMLDESMDCQEDDCHDVFWHFTEYVRFEVPDTYSI